MRTFPLRLAIVIATASLLSAAQAAGPGSPAPAIAANSSVLQRQVSHQINRHIVYPLSDHEGEMCGQVDVSFVVNVAGRIVVLAANSRNAALRDYVVAKLGRVQVDANPSGIWHTTHVRFVFRPEHAEARR